MRNQRHRTPSACYALGRASPPRCCGPPPTQACRPAVAVPLHTDPTPRLAAGCFLHPRARHGAPGVPRLTPGGQRPPQARLGAPPTQRNESATVDLNPSPQQARRADQRRKNRTACRFRASPATQGRSQLPSIKGEGLVTEIRQCQPNTARSTPAASTPYRFATWLRHQYRAQCSSTPTSTVAHIPQMGDTRCS